MKNRKLSGSVTIEAALALSLFIFGYLAVISLVFAVRTESAVQYGIDRAASEISRYCYAAERLSLTQYVRKSGVTVGEAIESIGGFSNMDGSTPDDESSGRIVSEIADALTGGATIGGIAGEPLIRAVFRGCLADSREKADEYLSNLAGITADDIDFHYSTLLRDGKTIEIIAVYDVKLRTYGLFGKKGLSLRMKNSAVTSAWVTGELAAVSGNKPSKWNLSSFERGKAWVAEIKSEHSMDAVKGGKGIDLVKGNTYTMINSVNLFAGTYSDGPPGSTDPSAYKAKEEAIEKAVAGYASKLLECIRTKASSLQYENGIHVPDRSADAAAELIIIVPEEVLQSDSLRKALEKTAAGVLADKGVTVRYEYREKAFTDTETGEIKK